MIKWSTDRRNFLKAAGALGAAAVMRPGFAWSADGDTLRLRMEGDLQVLDPAFMIGGIDDVMMRWHLRLIEPPRRYPRGCAMVALGCRKARAERSEDHRLHADRGTEMDQRLRPGDGGGREVLLRTHRQSRHRVAWAYQFEKLDHVEVIDERYGIIHLKNPYQPIFVVALPYYGGHIVCKAATEKVGGKYTTEIAGDVRTLPVRQSWEQKQKVTLTANPDWPGQKPDFSTVEIYHRHRRPGRPARLRGRRLRLHQDRRVRAPAAVKASPPPNTDAHRGAVDPLCLADHQHDEPRG